MVENDIIIDYESLGMQPDGMVVDLAAVVFKDNEEVPDFKELKKNAFHVKFKIKDQKGKRVSDQSVKEFWKKQPKEAQKILYPSDVDVTVEEGTKMFLDWCKRVKVNFWKSHIYSRGNEFDLGFLTNILRETFNTRDTFKLFPVAFWNARDVRTAIENRLLTRDMVHAPLKKGVLDGFVKHSSVDDCACAVMELIYARRYALGLDEPPSEDEVDENTVNRRVKH
ncbi:MAG: hypothetical protein CL489_08390 [Acidobacteria bacterium]|nr:hypothetical protein [Acidobacteriota bacterium]|tara:strand:- start:58585 stop:59256 length:672 start_codon:yes stop_codon:yes gene_type:complete